LEKVGQNDFGSSENDFDSNSSGGVFFLMELKSFWKTLGKRLQLLDWAAQIDGAENRDGSFTRGYPILQARVRAAKFARGRWYRNQNPPADS
jgi:hypothetical protein